MKQSVCYFILMASTHMAYAEITEKVVAYSYSERYIYVNSNLIGYFPVCINDANNDIFLPDAFFEQVHLKKLSVTTTCRGRLYTKTPVSFIRNNASETLSTTTTSADFAPLSDEASTSTVQNNDVRAKNVVIQASSLQHGVGFTRDASNTNITMNAAAQYYSDAGMFMMEGVAASESGKTRSYIRDVNWKRHFTESATNASFGLSTIAAAGSAVRLYGFVLGSDEETLLDNSAQSINGFAEVFGKIQIRSRGVLLKEISVAAGNFSIPTVGLPGSLGAPGQYTLSLVDDAGRTVRSWDVFVPLSSRLLRQGRANWSVYAGQIENGFSSHSLLGGPQNPGAGFTYSYGLHPQLTANTFSVLSPHIKGIGLAATAVPTTWMSMTAGQALYANKEQGGVSTYGGVDLHVRSSGVSANIARLNCGTQFNSGISASAASDGTCNTASFNFYTASDYFGRLSFQHNQSSRTLFKSSSNGFGWSPPPFRTVSLSLYGNRLTDSNSSVASTSVGFTLSIPFARGQLMNNANYSSPSSKTVATTYDESINSELQYSMTAAAGNDSGSSLRGGLQFRPWYGSYQANAQIGQNGQQSIGANESGALVFAQQQVLTSQASMQGYAIVHLDKLSNVPLEDGNGNRQTVINRNGYAAIPVSRGSEPTMHIAAEELPDDINIVGNVMGHINDNWQATLWEPSVHVVKKGWVRLMLSKGIPVPFGAALHLKPNAEPVYVLAAGDTYFDDFPSNAKQVEVSFPGNRGRCLVDLSTDASLKLSNLSNKPEFICVAPIL